MMMHTKGLLDELEATINKATNQWKLDLIDRNVNLAEQNAALLEALDSICNRRIHSGKDTGMMKVELDQSVWEKYDELRRKAKGG